MRTLLISLSLAATVLASPVLAAENDRLVATEASIFDFDTDVSTSSPAPEPVLQYAVIRYYLVPQTFSPRPVFLVLNEPSLFDIDLRSIPAAQFRIKAFRDEMHERYGELSYWV